MLFKVAQKVNIKFGNFSENFVSKNFKKLPDLVTLICTHRILSDCTSITMAALFLDRFGFDHASKFIVNSAKQLIQNK